MATEEGIVTAPGSSSDTAWVKTVQNSACAACSSRHACEAGSTMKIRVEALNPARAKVGDRIVLKLDSAALLKASFLIYVFPIICMLGGAIAGQNFAPAMGLDGSAGSALIGIGCFLVGILFMHLRGNQLSRKEHYKPKIIRILPTISPGAEKPEDFPKQCSNTAS